MEIISTTEQALIGALLLSQKKMPDVLGIVKVEDFSTLAGAKSFRLIGDMWKKKQNIDLISMVNADLSMADYLSKSTSIAFTPAVAEYAWTIAKEGKARRIKEGLSKILTGQTKPEPMLESILTLYQQEMTVGKKNPAISSVLKRFNAHVAENKQKGSMGFLTGFQFLQKLYVQYVPGHIWTIGGFTSVGKTAVMIQKICNLIALGEFPSILVISTEMTEEQVVARIIANFTGIHSHRILSGKFRDEEEADRAEHYKHLLKEAKLAIHDDIYTLGDIETAFRKADLQGGVNVGFIDYVQNVRYPEAKSQYQEQSEIAKRLQCLAKDVRATIICLSQVSNEVGRGNTDQFELKGAGEWAAVSDLGIFLQRHTEDSCKMKYSIKKNRHGGLDVQELEYKMDFTKLEERPKKISNNSKGQ